MLKKCLVVAVVVGCFSFAGAAKAQDCPRTPVRTFCKKVYDAKPVRTFCKKVYDARPIRTSCKKVYDARPIRTLFKRKPLRSLFKGRSCSRSCYYESKRIEDLTIPIPLAPVPAPATIPDA